MKKDRDTTKLRVVYDGSATTPTRKESFNDLLFTGPNYIPQIFDIITKFRMNPIGLVADIEKAFLMIAIAEEDRDMLRFLWFDDCNKPNPKFVEYRFCRLVFGLRPSPAILGATIEHHLELHKEHKPKAVETIKNCLYVDDFVAGAEDENQAFTIYKEAKDILLSGGFNLRKWNSNSKKLVEAINNEEEKLSTAKPKVAASNETSQVNTTIDPIQTGSRKENSKVLGVIWNTDSDEFMFNLSELIEFASTLPVTKRSVLKLTSKIFDPIGLLSPFTIKMKSMFQELCKNKSGWDDELQGKEKGLDRFSFTTEHS